MTMQSGTTGQVLVVDVNHDNTRQEVITITDNKLELILIKHLSTVETSKSWQTPFGLLVTIIIVFCTSDFKKAWGVSADTWSAVFIIFALITLIWLIYCVVKYKHSESVDNLMATIKNTKV